MYPLNIIKNIDFTLLENSDPVLIKAILFGGIFTENTKRTQVNHNPQINP